MMSITCHGRRKGIAAVLSVIIIFAMIAVIVVGFFAFMLTNNLTLNQAAQSKEGVQLAQAGEHLSLMVAHYSQPPSHPEFGIRISNTGSASSTITAVYVTSPSGQALSSGVSGSEYLLGPAALNITLPLSILPGSNTAAMTACSGKACNIGIYASAIPSYNGKGDVEINVLTLAGSVFTAQYPTSIAVATTTSTSAGTTSTSILPGGSESTTSVTTSTIQESWSGSTTTIVGQGTPSLILSLSALCAGTCASQSVLNGGTIAVTGAVTNLATSQATGVELVMAPPDGVPTGTASVTPSGSCSPASTTIAAGGQGTFTCLYSVATGATGGTITFDGYAMGTISGNAETSADAASNTLQVGYSSAGAPVALSPFSFNFTSVGQTVTGHSGVSAAHISDAATYVALYATVTNVYGQPLTLMDLTDISTQSPYVGPDPAFYMVSGVTYPTSGTPTITPYDCYPGSAITGCTTIPVGGSVTIIFAACQPSTGSGTGNDYGDGSSTWVWTTNGKIGEADTSASECASGSLGFAPPVGSSIAFVLFYMLGSTTTGTLNSVLLPFSSMFVTLPTTLTVTCPPVGLDEGTGTAPCTGTVTCTDPYGQTSGSPTDGCPASDPPTGDLSFTISPTSGISPSSSQCQLVEVSNTVADCSVTFTPSAVGSYTVSASYPGDSEHGPSSGQGTLTVNPTLTAGTITPSAPTIDSGQSVTLSASWTGGTPTYTVTWHSGTSATCSADTTVVATHSSLSTSPDTESVSPTTSTYYCAVIADSSSGSVTDAAIKVTVDPALVVPVPTVTHNPADVGESVTFTASPSGGSGTYTTYTWTGLPTGCTASNSATITCSPSTTTGSPFSVKVAVTDTNSNTVTSSALSFTVDPALTVALSATKNPVDVSQATTLSATASGGSGTYSTYVWSGLPAGCSSSAASFSCTPTSNSGSPYTVQVAVTDSNGYTATKTLTLTVDPALSAGTLSATKNPLDVGQTTTLSSSGASGGSGSGTYTYAWTNLPTGCSSSNAASITCTPTSATGSPFTVTLTVTDANGGTATATLSLTVDPALSAGTLSATHNPVDVSEATTISTSGASGGTGSGTYTYSWSGLPGGCSSSNAASIGCTPSSTTGSPFTVTLTVTDSNGETATATLSLTVDPTLTVPVPAATHNPADVGESVTFTASPSGGSGTYSTYTWTGLPTGCTASNSATITCSPSTTTGSPFSVSVAVTDSNGYTVTSSVLSFTVKPALSVSLTASPTTIDNGQTSTLTATASGGSGTYSTYAFYSGSTCTGTALQSGTSTTYKTPALTSTTTYCVQVTDSDSGTATGTVTVTVNAALTVSLTASPSAIDSGQKSTLTATASGGSGTYSTYAFYSGSTCTGTALQSGTSTTYKTPALTSTTTYCVQVTDSLGSSATSTVTVTVNAALTSGSITPSAPVIDSGQSITLSASWSGGTSGFTVTWYSGSSATCSSDKTVVATNSDPASPNPQSVSPTSTTYYCAVIQDSGSPAESVTDAAVMVTVDPALVVPVPTVNHNPASGSQSVTFTASPSGGSGLYSTYTWSGLPPQCTASNSKTITCTPTTAGTYSITVTVTDSNGDTVTSSALSFKVN